MALAMIQSPSLGYGQRRMGFPRACASRLIEEKTGRIIKDLFFILSSTVEQRTKLGKIKIEVF